MFLIWSLECFLSGTLNFTNYFIYLEIYFSGALNVSYLEP